MTEVRSQGSEDELQPWSERLQATADQFNEDCPVGTPVCVWPGVRHDGSGFDTKTRSEAFVLMGHTPAVFVEGKIGCIALTYVKPIDQEGDQP